MNCRQRNVSVAAHALWRNEVDFDEAPTLLSSHSIFSSTRIKSIDLSPISSVVLPISKFLAMGDPLSVLASVVGILAAATKIASGLSSLRSSLADAPRSLDHALSQVYGIKIALSAIEKLLCDDGGTVTGQLGLIHVDDLIVTLTEAVMTFDELETLLSPFLEAINDSMRERIKWSLKDDQIESLLVRLDRHKSTFILMMTIAHS